MDGGFGGNTVVLKFVGFDRLSSFSFLIGGFTVVQEVFGYGVLTTVFVVEIIFFTLFYLYLFSKILNNVIKIILLNRPSIFKAPVLCFHLGNCVFWS